MNDSPADSPGPAGSRDRGDAAQPDGSALEGAGSLGPSPAVADAIVHDVRNWLTVALGHLTLLEGEDVSPGERRVVAARRALEAAMSLLGRWEEGEGGSADRRRIVDLAALVRDTVQLAGPVAGSPRRGDPPGSGIDVDAAVPVRVVGDREALRRCLLNLIVNAEHAVREGGSIAVTVADASLWVELSVRDTGVGMDAQTLARCRESGFTTKASGGSGLGLRIVREIVASHGGDLLIESAPRKGTRVRIRLPRAEAATTSGPEATVATDRHGRSPTSPKAATGTVLLVEDEPDVAEVLADLCALAGFAVDVAPTAAEALRRCRTRPPQVLVIDAGLPDLPGPDLAKRIRQEQRSVGIVLLSGRIDAGTQATPDVIDFSCTKPVSYERLREVLFEARRRQAEREGAGSPSRGSEATG